MAERTNVAKKVFVNGDGEETRHASPDAETLRFNFVQSGETRDVRLAEMPDNIRAALAWHGLSQKLGDAYAGQKAKDDDPEDLLDAVLQRLQSGEWVQAGERAEGVPSLIYEAVIAGLAEVGRDTDDEALHENVKEQLKSKEGKAKALATPVFRKHYDRIRAERAAERAAKSAEQAGSETGNVDDFLNG